MTIVINYIFMPELRKIELQSAKISPLTHDREVAVMQKAVVNLFDRWGLTDDQSSALLGEIAVRTYQRWKSGNFGRVGIDLATRMSNLLGIHKSLRLLFIEPQRGYDWIKKSNLAFHGKSALEVMLEGQITDLMRVRRYLDSIRN